MPGSLENVTVDNFQYEPEATATFQLPTYKVALSVLNEPVYMQFLLVQPGERAQAGVWSPNEEFTPPVIGSINRPYLIAGVRFRMTVAVGGAILPVVSARPG